MVEHSAHNRKCVGSNPTRPTRNEIKMNKDIISIEELHKFFWEWICNSCDCENYPECPENTDGCFALTLAQELYNKMSGE